MSRILKFRAWDGEAMYSNEDRGEFYWFEYGSEGLGLVLNEQHFESGSGVAVENWRTRKVDAIFMQFTGLHDKNGKEIYEGDLVRAPHDFGPGGFSDRVFKVYFNTNEGSYQWNYWLMKEAEVIGNIYENSDLLEESK